MKNQEQKKAAAKAAGKVTPVSGIMQLFRSVIRESAIKVHFILNVDSWITYLHLRSKKAHVLQLTYIDIYKYLSQKVAKNAHIYDIIIKMKKKDICDRKNALQSTTI